MRNKVENSKPNCGFKYIGLMLEYDGKRGKNNSRIIVGFRCENVDERNKY